MANYVKFLRGTPAAYSALETKNTDTLYFISEPESLYGKLYLGSKLIAGSEADEMLEKLSLGDLSDVEIDSLISEDKMLLAYNTESEKWENKKLSDLVFVGATTESNGKSGLIIAPKAGEEKYFLRGDGTWAVAQDEIEVFELNNSENKTHQEILPNSGISKGDVAIVKDLIANEKYQFTSYIYDGSKWIALDSGYNADNIYFDEDIVVSSGAISTKGKSLTEIVQLLYREDKPDLVDDDATIDLENNVISLKDFGKRYYKYVDEVIEGEETIEAHYELQEVDENHPWKAGLEPKVVSENNILVLGWYEPNPTTIEGVNSQVTAIQTTVSDLQKSVSELTSKDTELTAAINSKANTSDVYTKDETETLINQKIVAADHLKRKIVEKFEDIQAYIDANEDEDQYIFMVPTGPNDYDNKYLEYIVIDGVIEQVGNWSVDLDDYVTETELTTALGNKVDKAEGYGLISDENTAKLISIESGAEKNVINAVDNNFSISTDGNRTLSIVSLPKTVDLSENASIVNIKNALTSSINTKVTIVEGKDLVSVSEINKLATVQEGAEKNVVNAVSEEFAIDSTTRTLSIVSVDGSKINLKNNEDFNTLSSKAEENSSEIITLKTSVDNLTASINAIPTTYVTLTKHNEDKTSLQNQLDEVKQQLTWEEMPN